MRPTTTALALSAAILGAAACGACGVPSQDEADAVRRSVAAVAAPSGWSEVGALETACLVANLDCLDPSARRVFATTSSPAVACAALVSWVRTTGALGSPTAVVGTDTGAAPDAEACGRELASFHRYLVQADAAGSLPGHARWALRLTPVDAGAQLSVVLGDPPRDPWR